MTGQIDKDSSGVQESISTNKLSDSSLMHRMQWHLAWENAFFAQQNAVAGESGKDVSSYDAEPSSKSKTRVVDDSLNELYLKNIIMKPMDSAMFAKSMGTTYVSSTSSSLAGNHNRQIQNTTPVYGTNVYSGSELTNRASKIPESLVTKHFSEVLNLQELEKVTMIRQGNDVRIFLRENPLSGGQSMQILANLRDVLSRNGLRLISVKINQQMLWEMALKERSDPARDTDDSRIDEIY